MPCPYAEIRGLIAKRVYCKLAKKIVDHRKYPCLSELYKYCEIYRSAVPKEESEVIAPSEREEQKPSDKIEEMVNEAVKNAKKYYDPKKGEKPPTCYDCLYFSPTTHWCLMLKRKVKDPNKPECYQ